MTPTPKTTLSSLQLITPLFPPDTSTISVDSTVLPVTVLADADTIRIELLLYDQMSPVTAYIPTLGGNQFSTSIAIDQTIDETVVQIVGRNYDPKATWLPQYYYLAGYRYADTNGNVQVVVSPTNAPTVTGAASGIGEPIWSTVTDPTYITKIEISGNNLSDLTVTCNNSFVSGQKVYLTGLTNASFLNGVLVTVVTPGSTQFVASFSYPAGYPATQEKTGIVMPVITDGKLYWANYGNSAITPTIKFNLLAVQSSLALAIAPPSGILAKKNQTTCNLEWVTPEYPGFLGVRVMVSTDQAGINPPYTQFGDLVTSVSRIGQSVINTDTNTSVSVPTAAIKSVTILNNTLTVAAINNFDPGALLTLEGLTKAAFLNGEMVTVDTADDLSFTSRIVSPDYLLTPDSGTATSTISTNTITSVQTVMTSNYSSVNIPSSWINSGIFYALFSTVVQEPSTNVIYESVQNGPLLGGFVNLKMVSPTDFPALQRKEDIAGRLIGQIIRQRPNLDLSPRSEIRDIFIDPFSIETANMSVREWFARVSSSPSAISQIDDTTGTGTSDPFQSSPYKQQIARAYGLSSQDTQSLINEQFDILGEGAGLTRLSARQSTVILTFYTYQQPQQSITVPQQATVATVADSNTPALNFVTQGQATISLSNLNSFYSEQYGWWGISVPAQCTSSGSNGNVGAGTIRQVVSNVPSGLNVTNLVSAAYGIDNESNSSLAARIQAKNVTGVDSGTRHGYWVTALGTPGITGAQVVAAGDLEMVRDWDPIRQKHVFGTVDIYTRGVTTSQQDATSFFQYASTGTYGQIPTYLPINLVSGLQFQLADSSKLLYSLYTAVELQVSSSGNIFYLGVERAQFDSAGNLTLHPDDAPYKYAGSSLSKLKIPHLTTNTLAVASLSGVKGYTFSLFARYQSPFTLTPTLQPVLNVLSITGQTNQTGVVSTNAIDLIHTSDFLLNGGSNDAGDYAKVSIISNSTQKTITAYVSAPTLIDTAMDVSLNLKNQLDVISIRNVDHSTLYTVGIDYQIVPLGAYHTYGLQVVTVQVPVTSVSVSQNVVTIVANNNFGVGAKVTFKGLVYADFLNDQILNIATVTPTGFTATATGFAHTEYLMTAETGMGTALGSTIQDSQQVIITYNQFALYERPTFVPDEIQTLNGTLPTPLNNNGFINNVWLPESYSSSDSWTYPNTDLYLTLVMDGWNGKRGLVDEGMDIVGSTGLVGAQIPHDSRYIKVTYNNGVIDVVKKENIDFSLSIDPVSGATGISRKITGTIPDGGAVKISYFYLEPFVFSTQYPAFVQALANQLAVTKHAAADVLVKAMVPNQIDITLAITLNPSASPESVDSVIRTIINIVLDNATGTLYQSELISQVQAIIGVQSVAVPLLKCAKSDGSYNIGVVILTGTEWVNLSNDPLFSSQTAANVWITGKAVLPESTLPSGGQLDSVVNLLYQGQVFRRATSIQNFLDHSSVFSPVLAAEGTPGSFYIIGTNDTFNGISVPSSYWQKIMLVLPPHKSVVNDKDTLIPSSLWFLCTYQVYNEGGASDITVSATEYLSPGRITINYLTS